MRKALRARVRPLVERFVADLTEVAASRIEAELERMGEALDVALSSFASEVTDADADRGDHDPVPHVRRRARRGLPGLEPQGRDDSSAAPAQAPAPRREEGERTARLVGRASDPLADALGPELAGMLTPAHAKRERDYKPENYPPSRRDREDRAALQANGKKPVTCQKCGYVGGNQRGCGRSHPTQRPLESTAPSNITDAAPRPATPERRATIAALARKPAPRPVGRDRDEEPDAFEDDEPLADRIARAEANKREGVLPEPLSSWVL